MNGLSDSRSLLWQGIGISSIYLTITNSRLYGLLWNFESTHLVQRPHGVFVRILHLLSFSNRDWFVSLLSNYGQTPLSTHIMSAIYVLWIGLLGIFIWKEYLFLTRFKVAARFVGTTSQLRLNGLTDFLKTWIL